MMKRRESGGVSIFIVIFTALLLTVATTSFVQLMVRNQQQASTNDLSQRAYDAALAGVEDAKRALIALSKCEGNLSEPCENLREKFTATGALQDCELLDALGVANFGDSHEVQVGDPSLNQAYTCVRINPNSKDHRGSLAGDSGGDVVALRGKGSFDRIKISWFSEDDVTGDDPASERMNLSFPTVSGGNPWPLPVRTGWNYQPSAKTPPILRAQLIQFKKKEIVLDRFDAQGDSDAHTAFLYPKLDNTRTVASYLWNSGLTRGGTNLPKDVSCRADIPAKGYACQVVLRIPSLANGGGSKDMYLQLAAVYDSTRYSVELLNSSGDPVDFSDSQATVDSTGRASSLFRRVSARVSVKPAPLKYPEAALTTKSGLCKNFFVTNSKDDYSSECN